MAKVEKIKAKEILPVGHIEIEGQYVRQAQDALVRAVLEAWRIKLEIEARKADYEALCGEIKSMLGAPASVVILGVCRAIYARPRRVTVADAEMLETVLGGRYLDLVKVEEKVSATDALVELASDGDDPLGRAVRQALKVSEGESITLKAEAPIKEAA